MTPVWIVNVHSTNGRTTRRGAAYWCCPTFRTRWGYGNQRVGFALLPAVRNDGTNTLFGEKGVNNGGISWKQRCRRRQDFGQFLGRVSNHVEIDRVGRGGLEDATWWRWMECCYCYSMVVEELVWYFGWHGLKNDEWWFFILLWSDDHRSLPFEGFKVREVEFASFFSR